MVMISDIAEVGAENIRSAFGVLSVLPDNLISVLHTHVRRFTAVSQRSNTL